jgi:hypothetical protein
MRLRKAIVLGVALVGPVTLALADGSTTIDANNDYGSANRALAGNGARKPRAAESATLAPSLPALKARSNPSDGVGGFGTAAGVAAPAPEPATVAFLGLGAVGLLVTARRRRGRANVTVVGKRS